MLDVKEDVLDVASDVVQLSSDLLIAEGDINDLETNDASQEEQISVLATDIAQLSADLVAAEGNIDVLETNDALQEERIGVLESTVNDYLDVAIGFHVTLNSVPQTLALGDAVLYDTVISNYGGAFNLISGSFVAPWHGLYVFASNFITSNPAFATDLCIMVNGICICSEVAGYSDNIYDTGTCTALVELQPNDIVNVVLHYDGQSDGGEVHGYQYTGFSGWLYKAL